LANLQLPGARHAFTGLRRGELIGLRWEEIGFEELVIHIKRSVVAMGRGCAENGGLTERCSLERSNSGVVVYMAAAVRLPIEHGLGICFAAPQRQAAILARDSVALIRQTRRYSRQGQQECLVPYLQHTFGTLLKANGENPKVVQELLRHASLKVTTDVYMQAVSSQKRDAQSKLVRMVRQKAAAD
jgi:integrase